MANQVAHPSSVNKLVGLHPLNMHPWVCMLRFMLTIPMLYRGAQQHACRPCDSPLDRASHSFRLTSWCRAHRYKWLLLASELFACCFCLSLGDGRWRRSVALTITHLVMYVVVCAHTCSRSLSCMPRRLIMFVCMTSLDFCITCVRAIYVFFGIVDLVI